MEVGSHRRSGDLDKASWCSILLPPLIPLVYVARRGTKSRVVRRRSAPLTGPAGAGSLRLPAPARAQPRLQPSEHRLEPRPVACGQEPRLLQPAVAAHAAGERAHVRVERLRLVVGEPGELADRGDAVFG